VMPAPFQIPSMSSIQKTVGLFVIHRITADLVKQNRIDPATVTPSQVHGLLSRSATYMNVGYWRTGGQVASYSSGAGHRVLAGLILAEI
jgi:hypothetical protein